MLCYIKQMSLLEKGVIENVLPVFVTFVLIAKVVFIIFSVFIFTSKSRRPVNDKWVVFARKVKDIAESIFTFCTAFILVVIFNPWANNVRYITPKLKTLFYTFGIVTIGVVFSGG